MAEAILIDDFAGAAATMVGRTVGGWVYANPPAIGFPAMAVDGAGHAGASAGGTYSSIALSFPVADAGLFDYAYIDINLTAYAGFNNPGDEAILELGLASHGDKTPSNLYLTLGYTGITVEHYTHGAAFNINQNVNIGDIVTLRIPMDGQLITAEVLYNGAALHVQGTIPFTMPDPFCVTLMTNVLAEFDQLGVQGGTATAPPVDGGAFQIHDDFNGAAGSIMYRVPNVVTGLGDFIPKWQYNTWSTFPFTDDVLNNSNNGWLMYNDGNNYPLWVKSGSF